MNKYSEVVMENVRQALGLEDDDESSDDKIMAMEKSEVLGLYWQWNGIIGYETEILESIEDIFNITLI